MIIRIYRGTVLAGKAGVWEERVQSLSIPWLKKQGGLVACYPGRLLADAGGRTFCMVTIWDSVEAIVAAVGPDWNRPIYVGDEENLIEASSVESFEVLP
jgi:hypothetical protein